MKLCYRNESERKVNINTFNIIKQQIFLFVPIFGKINLVHYFLQC